MVFSLDLVMDRKADDEMHFLDRRVRHFRGLFHLYNNIEVRNDLQVYDEPSEPNDQSLTIASYAIDGSPARTG